MFKEDLYSNCNKNHSTNNFNLVAQVFLLLIFQFLLQSLKQGMLQPR